MPPKKTGTGAAKKASTASHASYSDMIKEAIINLKDRAGSSRQAIKKYVQANNNITGVTDAQFTSQFNRALQKGSETGTFSRPKGPSGPVKLAAPKSSSDSKTATKTGAKTATKKTATKSTTKKAPAKKTTTAKTATKKAPATKSKANTSKVRKTPTAAPAVVEKAPVVIGTTKSGRVTKSKAPQPTKATAPKKAGVKKAVAAKKATPKKA